MSWCWKAPEFSLRGRKLGASVRDPRCPIIDSRGGVSGPRNFVCRQGDSLTPIGWRGLRGEHFKYVFPPMCEAPLDHSLLHNRPFHAAPPISNLIATFRGYGPRPPEVRA